MIYASKNIYFVRLWLIFISVLVVAIVLVGGATRLTDSGLSITQWEVFSGVLPPLSNLQWQEAFNLYKQTTEFKIINSTMVLGEFKIIYWWEWAHRFLARILGLSFLIPFCIFWLKGMLSRQLTKHLAIIFCLIVLQGIIGWWMVKSGLVARVDVSHLRLAVHLFFACFIFCYLIFVSSAISNFEFIKVANFHIYFAFVLFVCLFMQVILGALLAGLDGGMAFNTWPKMGDEWIAQSVFQNGIFYENTATIQFVHRTFAFIVLLVAVVHVCCLYKVSRQYFYFSTIILLVILLQIIFGILALLTFVVYWVALVHQFLALCLLGLLSFHLQRLVRWKIDIF